MKAYGVNELRKMFLEELRYNKIETICYML